MFMNYMIFKLKSNTKLNGSVIHKIGTLNEKVPPWPQKNIPPKDTKNEFILVKKSFKYYISKLKGGGGSEIWSLFILINFNFNFTNTCTFDHFPL